MNKIKKLAAAVMAVVCFGTTTGLGAVVEKEIEDRDFTQIVTAGYENDTLPEGATVFITNTGTDIFNESVHTFETNTVRLKAYRGNGAQFNERKGLVTFEYDPPNLNAEGLIKFETKVTKGMPHNQGRISLVFEEGVKVMTIEPSWRNVSATVTCTYNTYTGECKFLFDGGEEYTEHATEYAVNSDYSPMKLKGFSIACSLSNDTRVHWTIGEVWVSYARLSHAELNKVGNGASLSWYKRQNESTTETEDYDTGFIIQKSGLSNAKITSKKGTKNTTVSFTAENTDVNSSVGFVLENLVDCTPTLKTKAGASYTGGIAAKSSEENVFATKTSLGANGEKLLNIDCSLDYDGEHNAVWFLVDKSAAASADALNLENALSAGKVIDAGLVTMDGKKGENLLSVAVNMGSKEAGQYYFVIGDDKIDLTGKNIKAVAYTPDTASAASLSVLKKSTADNLEKNLKDCIDAHAPLAGIDLSAEPYASYSTQVLSLLIDAIKDCNTFADVRTAFEESSIIAEFNSMTSSYDKVQYLKDNKEIFNCDFEGDYTKYKMTAGEYMKYFQPKYETTKMMSFADISAAHYYALAMRSINYVKQWSKNSEFEYVLASYNGVFGLDLNNAKYKANKADVYKAFEGITLVVPSDVLTAFNAWVKGETAENLSDCSFVLDNLQVTADKLSVDVTRRLSGDGKAIVVALYYDGAGKLVGMSTASKSVGFLQTANVTIQNAVKNASKVRVHAWDTSSGMKMASAFLSNK